MKPFATVLDAGTSRANRTGSWRAERPIYVNRLPPCNGACPAGENVQKWLGLVEQEKYEDAWRALVKNNPFPATMGRICYHPCESACNRSIVDAPVGINDVERFLGDMALREKWAFVKTKTSSDKKVLVIGAGPAGLSAAYHLALLGHKVTIKEAMKKPGGMLRYGIPQYRLPRQILDAEIERILNLGIVVETETKEPALAGLVVAQAYDAVFLSMGASFAKKASFPSDAQAQVFDAIAVLRDIEGGTKPSFGKHVVVYGGGNTAIDTARTARRLGAEQVTIVYRRTREKMPAHAFEVDEALQEGIQIKFLATIEKAEGKKLTLQKMQLDEKGLPKPTGEKEEMNADCVILATGQEIDKTLFEGFEGIDVVADKIKVDERMMTGRAGIFAGGDAVSSERTATTALGHGKKAARGIDAWLRNAEHAAQIKNDPATADRLNTWYYAEAPRAERRAIELARRVTTFDETQMGLALPEALSEARRCLSCGNCFECGNCYGVCPDNAIKKLGAGLGFQIDYDYCKGCGLCAAECPCGCIDLEPEKI
jgi:NADPH-dependent glutamate synthase beta subunit-like oxidoreductase